MVELLCLECGYSYEVNTAGLIRGAKKTLYYICEDCAHRLRELEDTPEDTPED